jgi:hypothetical protein
VLGTCGARGDDRPSARAGAAAAVQPSPPRAYRVPHGARRVSTSRELRAALAAHLPRSIVLAPGAYESRMPFLNPWGHRIYSARLGAAVLRAGLSLGGNDGRPGALVRGVVVDVDDPARTVDGAAIAVWGAGRGARILDTTLDGHGALRAGVSAGQPDGLQIRRLRARGFSDYGVVVDANEPTGGRFRLEDLDVASVGRPQPGSSGGRAEACVWIGNTGTVRRVRARSCAWSGLWTGTAATHALFDQIDVDDAPTGVYVEHFTTDSTFARLRIGRRVRVGLVTEWADPAWGGRPASVGNVIRDSRFESWLVGVYLDEGTTRTTVRDSAFANQRWGAIGDYRGRANRQYGNAFDGLAPGAQPVRHDHLNSFRGG